MYFIPGCLLSPEEDPEFVVMMLFYHLLRTNSRNQSDFFSKKNALQCEINKVNNFFLFSPLCVGIDQCEEVTSGEKVLIFKMKFLVQTRDGSNIRTIEQTMVQCR